MVGRIGGDLGLECGGVGAGAGALGELDGGDHAGDRPLLAPGRRDQCNGLLGAGDVAALQVAAGETGDGGQFSRSS